MAQRRFHYEQAFEHYLRANRVPYVAVDEAKKTLLPKNSDQSSDNTLSSLKSFDFVVYAPKRNLLVDVKGRMYGRTAEKKSHTLRHFESWVTRDDVESLEHWQRLFGKDFQAVFVFAYCLRQQPPDALFEELFSYDDRWYALREVGLHDYRGAMVQRSPKWKTVCIPAAKFSQISQPFSAKENSRKAVCKAEQPAIPF